MANTAAVLDAFGDASRRRIVEELSAGPLPVGVLATHLPLSRPAVSQHLKVLKDAGLVRDEAAGTRRLYRLDPEGLAAIREYFDRFWHKALSSYASAVDAPSNAPAPEGARPTAAARHGAKPRRGGPRSGGPRSGGPRSGGPRSGGPRST